MSVFKFKKDDRVQMVEPTHPGHRSRRGGLIKTGTRGRVIARRLSSHHLCQYLVKFQGHGGDRHTNEYSIEELT